MAAEITQKSTRKLSFGRVLLLTFFFLLVFSVLFSRAMLTSLNHDEYQFVAGGQLLVERGLLPYRDYPFLHMPYMIALNALVFKLTEYDFLAARLLTAIGGGVSAGFVFLNIYRFSAGASKTLRYVLGCVAVLLFIMNTAYIDANGRALNHAAPNLLGLLAMEAFYRGLKSKRCRLYFLSVGVLTGLAVGMRLTYALLIPAFSIAIFFFPLFGSTPEKSTRNRIGLRNLFFLGCGIFAALLPVLLLALAAPKQFLFGNFVYIRLNTGYREVLDYGEAMTLSGKLAYFAENVLSEPVNGLLYALALGFCIFAILKILKTKESKYILSASVTLLGLLMFISAFGPTPTWPQYFFAPLPYLVIAGMGLVTLVHRKYLHLGWVLTVLVIGLTFANGAARQAFSDLAGLKEPGAWVPIQVHQFGQEIKQVLPEGKVLTLVPIFPLEAGLDTYEMFAVGPLVWRSAHILSQEKRQEYGIIALTDLDRYLQDRPPDAILLGVEDRYDGFWIYNAGALEVPLVEYAEYHGYRPVELTPGFGEGIEVLWVK